MADKTPVSQSQKPVQAQPQAKGDKLDAKAEGKAKKSQQEVAEMGEACQGQQGQQGQQQKK